MGGSDTSNKKSASETVGVSFGNSVGAYSRDTFRTVLDRQSVDTVRAAIAEGKIPRANILQAHQWIADQEAPKVAEKEFIDTVYRSREVEAAEKSADASTWSTRFSALALIISIISLGVSLYNAMKP